MPFTDNVLTDSRVSAFWTVRMVPILVGAPGKGVFSVVREGLLAIGRGRARARPDDGLGMARSPAVR